MRGDDHLDLSEYNHNKHAGVLLDGVGDVCVVKRNREMLQGRPKECKGGKSANASPAPAQRSKSGGPGNKMKKDWCVRFLREGGCPNGQKCHFAHLTEDVVSERRRAHAAAVTQQQKSQRSKS